MTQGKLSIALFTILAFFVCGCGQKGALYLPRAPLPAEPAATEPSEAEAEEEQENDQLQR